MVLKLANKTVLKSFWFLLSSIILACKKKKQLKISVANWRNSKLPASINEFEIPRVKEKKFFGWAGCSSMNWFYLFPLFVLILRQIKSVAKTYDICNNTLTVENVTLLACWLSVAISDKSNLSIYCHTALIRYPDNLLDCHLIVGRCPVSLMSIKKFKLKLIIILSDLNPYNYCPLAIVQVVKSSDMH